MEKQFKQFAAIATNWVPNNPVKAFLPFFYYYINNENGKTIKIDSFSKGLERTFGIHFPYHVISSTLAYLRSTGEASLEDNTYWSFSLKPENKKITTLQFNDSRNALLIESFKRFYPNEEEIQKNAESILDSFFSKYDHEIMLYNLDSDNEGELIKYDYFVAKFIDDLRTSNVELFEFVIQIAKGSIVKSAILNNEHYDVKLFNGVVYYLDTKVLFFLLGYYGEFFKNEYLDFIATLKKVGAKVAVTDYVYNEVISVLRICENYVESDAYRYELSFDILRSFRKNGYTANAVNEMIINLECDIASCGIELEKIPAKLPNSESFSESYEKLYEYLQDVYGYFDRDEFGNEYRAALETDIRSILYAYRIRNNNSIKSIKAAKVFFVTTNRALVRATNKYHEEMHKKTISPIATDDFIGVLLLGATENQSIPRIKLLSFCNECFDLGDKTRKEYIDKVNELERKKKITQDEVFLLKNSGLIDDVLLNNYEKNNFMVNDQCVYDVLSDINDRLTKDITSNYERRITDIEARHREEMEQLKKEHQSELETSIKSKNLAEEELLALKIKPYKRIFVAYYFCVAMLIALSLTGTALGICKIVIEHGGFIDWFIAVAGALLTVYSVIDLFSSIKNKNGPLYLLFKNGYDKKVEKIEKDFRENEKD